jgi:hypothetical protein
MITQQHWMRRVQAGDLQELHELAQQDRHEVIAPSHVFTKGADLVGYASIAQVALVLPWFHTERCQPRDSVYFINQMENLAGNILPDSGPGLICVPVVRSSPFQQHIARLGYLAADQATITFKKVR